MLRGLSLYQALDGLQPAANRLKPDKRSLGSFYMEHVKIESFVPAGPPVQLDLLAPLPKVKRKDMTLRQRLDELTVKQKNGCWIWKGHIDPGTIGYGRMWFQGERDYAHRWAYRDEHGDIPEGMQVRHSCHNPACRRGAHLLLGLPADNSADMVNANRQRRTLRKEEVIQIVAFHAKGRTVEHLAEQFKVSQVAIRKILSGKTHSKTTGIVFTPKHNHYEKVRQMKEAA